MRTTPGMEEVGIASGTAIEEQPSYGSEDILSSALLRLLICSNA
jgi:hypothetical protein